MLVIRMQRVGRKGHAQFRVVVQDSRRTPTSGRVVAKLGHYDPHTKQIVINKEQAKFYLDNGAQPSEKVTRLLKQEGVKLPKWVGLPKEQNKKTKHPEKLRKNQPQQETTKDSAPAEAQNEPADANAAVDEAVAQTEPNQDEQVVNIDNKLPEADEKA